VESAFRRNLVTENSQSPIQQENIFQRILVRSAIDALAHRWISHCSTYVFITAEDLMIEWLEYRTKCKQDGGPKQSVELSADDKMFCMRKGY
jgi:hypothetical protein